MSAPFAGTTTSSLANGHPRAAVQALPAVHDRTAALASTRLDVPVRAIVTLVGAEMLLIGVGAGVIVVARNRR